MRLLTLSKGHSCPSATPQGRSCRPAQRSSADARRIASRRDALDAGKSPKACVGNGRTAADAFDFGVGAIVILHESPGPSIANPLTKQTRNPRTYNRTIAVPRSGAAHPCILIGRSG